MFPINQVHVDCRHHTSSRSRTLSHRSLLYHHAFLSFAAQCSTAYDPFFTTHKSHILTCPFASFLHVYVDALFHRIPNGCLVTCFEHYYQSRKGAGGAIQGCTTIRIRTAPTWRSHVGRSRRQGDGMEKGNGYLALCRTRRAHHSVDSLQCCFSLPCLMLPRNESRLSFFC